MELFAAKYEMDYRALNERLLTKEQRPWMPPVTISLRLALNERLLPKEQRPPLQKQGDKQGFFSTKRALI